jgi:hypothetical protein
MAHRQPLEAQPNCAIAGSLAERNSTGSGWCMHDSDHATLRGARSYVEAVNVTNSALLVAW